MYQKEGGEFKDYVMNGIVGCNTANFHNYGTNFWAVKMNKIVFGEDKTCEMHV